MDRRPDSAASARQDLSWRVFLAACAVLVGLQLLLSFFHIRDVPLIDPDEPRYAAAGRTMAEGGDWLIPYFNGEPRINKPPLFYWMVAASCQIGGGSDELTSRLPSIVMGLLMLAFTIVLAAKLFSRRTALIAGAMLVSLPLYAVLSRTCITDMTLSTFLTGTLCVLALLIANKIPARSGTWLCALLFGFAILAKATPALVVILVVMIDRALSLPKSARPTAAAWIPWLIGLALLMSFASERAFDAGKAKEKANLAASVEPDEEAPRAYETLDSVFNKTALGLAAVVVIIIVRCAARAGLGPLKGLAWPWALLFAVIFGGWWYGALIGHFGWDRFKQLLLFEVGGRVLGQMHREPMYFYLYMIFGVAFPWSVGLIGSIGTALTGADQESIDGRADRFLVAWIFGVLLFFSIPGAKLPTYILPAAPALVILVARFFERLADSRTQIAARWRNVTWAMAIVCVAALAIVTLHPAWVENNNEEFIRKFPLPLWGFCIAAALAYGGGWLLVTKGRMGLSVVLMFAANELTLLAAVPASLYNFEHRSSRALCDVVRNRISDVTAGSGRIASVGAEVESLSYYLHTTVAESRRRRVKNKPEPGQPDVTEDEAFSTVVEEELARPEKVVLFIQRRYFARMMGINRKTLATWSREKIAMSLPANCRFIDMDDEIIVIRNLRS